MIKNPIIEIGVEDTGIDSGNLDYTIRYKAVEDLSPNDKVFLVTLVERVLESVKCLGGSNDT